MPSCIIVDGVSAADQKDGYSLAAQSRHANEYATVRGLEIAQEFTFQESASKVSEQRQFDQILKFVARYTGPSTEPLHIIVEKKDRWGRLHSRKEFIQQRVLASQLVVHYYRERQILDKTCSPEDIFMDDVVTSMNKYVALNIGYPPSGHAHDISRFFVDNIAKAPIAISSTGQNFPISS